MAKHSEETALSLHIGPTIAKGGTNISQVGTGSDFPGGRRKLNFIEGTNVTLTIADNSGADRTDITITAAGGGGGGATAYEQLTDGSTTIGDSSAISSTVLLSGRVDLPALATTTVTLLKGVGVPVTNIYSVFLTTKGNNGNVVYLENVAGNSFPKAGSTITINNNANEVISVYVFCVVN